MPSRQQLLAMDTAVQPAVRFGSTLSERLRRRGANSKPDELSVPAAATVLDHGIRVATLREVRVTESLGFVRRAPGRSSSSSVGRTGGRQRKAQSGVALQLAPRRGGQSDEEVSSEPTAMTSCPIEAQKDAQSMPEAMPRAVDSPLHSACFIRPPPWAKCEPPGECEPPLFPATVR